MKLLYTDPYDKNKFIEEYQQCIVVVGGDGTLLTAINEFSSLGKPFYGIAGGTVNFLMNDVPYLTPPKMTDVHHKFSLMTIDVRYLVSNVDQPYHRVATFHAFNDVVLGAFNGWIEFDCEHADNQLGNFKGSGIVISTAQGSTGINRNNGGTILPLTSPNWSVTGMQTNRTVNTVISPDHLEVRVTSRRSVTVAIDGARHILHNVSDITIRKGREVTVIFRDIEQLKQKRQ